MQLQTLGLTKRYGPKEAVHRLQLTLTPGVWGLLGANGAGKTTLMRLLCGLQRPTAGRILWNGKNIGAQGEKYRSVLGYLPQHFVCDPSFTAMDYLLYISAMKGLKDRQARHRSEELLDAVGLREHQREKVRTFSGGMKQRLGIAQAMLNDPRILVLDEPTTGLDPRERVRFRNMISALAVDRIVLLSTHIVSDVEFIAEEIILLKDGRMVQCGPPDAITREMDGRVWECAVPASQAEALAQRFQTCSLRSSESGQTVLRILSDRPPMPRAVPVKPILEDLYLQYFGGGAEL